MSMDTLQAGAQLGTDRRETCYVYGGSCHECVVVASLAMQRALIDRYNVATHSAQKRTAQEAGSLSVSVGGTLRRMPSGVTCGEAKQAVGEAIGLNHASITAQQGEQGFLSRVA